MVQLTKNIDILKNNLVPEHRVLSDKEKADVLEKYNISVFQLPVIKLKDPVAKAIEAKENDIVLIKRKGPSGWYVYFRRVAR